MQGHCVSSFPKNEALAAAETKIAGHGFLKIAYRNHSEHAHDDPYDMEKALHILNHTKFFMQALEKGGVSE
jgi:hypothetical protein